MQTIKLRQLISKLNQNSVNKLHLLITRMLYPIEFLWSFTLKNAEFRDLNGIHYDKLVLINRNNDLWNNVYLSHTREIGMSLQWIRLKF